MFVYYLTTLNVPNIFWISTFKENFRLNLCWFIADICKDVFVASRRINSVFHVVQECPAALRLSQDLIQMRPESSALGALSHFILCSLEEVTKSLRHDRVLCPGVPPQQSTSWETSHSLMILSLLCPRLASDLRQICRPFVCSATGLCSALLSTPDRPGSRKACSILASMAREGLGTCTDVVFSPPITHKVYILEAGNEALAFQEWEPVFDP